VPWVVRGNARFQRGDFRGATSDLERFLELAPEDPKAPAVRNLLADARKRVAPAGR